MLYNNKAEFSYLQRTKLNYILSQITKCNIKHFFVTDVNFCSQIMLSYMNDATREYKNSYILNT